ncbi:MAG TPA: PVC-type heme-binding CxxCH protein [Gemmataceae bacterium]|jgi:putative membrane-bound dehydrogenase-like protein|nr:PVC-type heme-binding CxxCH protein [Gemmataceae bacterium]
MNRVLLCISLLALLALPALPAHADEPPEGVLPLGADGKPLNLDFETGTLKDWTAEGDAFKGQPIEGDTVFARRSDMKSQHQGKYWIGTYERFGDKPQGTLTSVPFKVTHPWASFLVGGGSMPETCVEIIRKDTGKVIFRASGLDEENMKRVAVDLKEQMGKEIFLRLVDKHSGGWGHINFDDFRFHTNKPNVPPRGVNPGVVPPDQYKYAGLPPEKAAQVMTVPEGFTVQLFAGEPDVMQPIALCLDDRGRVWVAEAYTYPRRHPSPGPLLPEAERAKGDRIVIFEDSKGTGHFDKRTVFMEGLNLVSGLEVGFGGVWIGAAPYFMFVPIKEGEDKPAGPPQILLDGWHYEDTHETLNSFIWGPDGWLYGCHGVFTHSRVGKPGTPEDKRIPINAGIWRYHPTKHVFEVFAEGTSNPWGLDFNDYGQAFCEACVIPHCYHIIQGGHYVRQAGQHFNPYTYADIQTIADHLHWQGANQWAGNQISGSLGGGHAHAGLMVYLGGAWPKEYRGQLFMGNIHGRRINMDIPKPKGSGYVASHGPDFLLANDAWARFINMRYGPDGNVYLIDWYDKQACHLPQPEVWDRTNGRIYKISYRDTKPVTGIDLQKCSDEELVKYQLSDNDWYVRHARRILQEHWGGFERKPIDAHFEAIRKELKSIAKDNPDDTRRLRAFWALHVTGGIDGGILEKAVYHDKSPFVRGWSIQLALENREVSEAHDFPAPNWGCLLEDVGTKDDSPVVRRYVASAMQKLTIKERHGLEMLMQHGKDATDPNLPLLYWFALEPVAGDPKFWDSALDDALGSDLPDILLFTARRISATGKLEALQLLSDKLGKLADPPQLPIRTQLQLLILRGMQTGLLGHRNVGIPTSWPDVSKKLLASPNKEIRTLVTALAVTFGDKNAFGSLRSIVSDTKASKESRLNALGALVQAHDGELPPLLQSLLKDADLRSAALKGLAGFDDPKSPIAILAVFASLSLEEKRDALGTLASRPAYAKALLDALAANKLAPSEIPAEIVRQMRNLPDKEIEKRLGEVWGIVRVTPADRAKAIADMRKMLSLTATAPDLSLGRAIFAKTCSQCHTLYGVGGKVGPDITGSNRSDLAYLLENILDPSAVIPKDYAATRIDLKNGRTVTGIVKGETPVALTVVTQNETLTIPVADIEKRELSDTSMMPEDLLKDLKEPQIRALIAYLRYNAQVPYLATEDNAKDLFNGKDLTGWDGDMKLWSVENGEIVGKTTGLKKNEFLKSQMVAADFRLSLKVKLTPNKENSGVQFRSEALPDGEMKGPQADIGAGWWGKLYEESARGVLSNNMGEKFVKPDEWNDYEILAVGSKVRTWINGQLCVDIDDPMLSRRGIFGLQLHAGGPMEVRFKDLKFEVNPEWKK